MDGISKKQVRRGAFSLVELLAVVATVAIIGSIAVAVINNSGSSIKESKLEQQVSSLNSSIEVFLASGGTLSGIDTAQGVLTELKRSAANELQVVGMRGGSVDLRLQAIEESEAELRDRAIWRADLNKFIIAKSGTGVREFVLNEALAAVNYENVARDTPLVYNDANGWVWETRDFNFVASTGPSSLPTTDAPALGVGGGGGSANGSRLNPPVISPGSGSLALASFPLQVSISKHAADPEGTSLFVSTRPGTWTLYEGPVRGRSRYQRPGLR